MKIVKVQQIKFNGKIYRRYPDSDIWVNKWYFHSTEKKYLHRDIWEFYKGKIPIRCHIHHKDENPLNNDIDNLECLSHSEHMKKHSNTRNYSECGKKAWKLWQKKEKICSVCGKTYKVFRASQSRYCSDSCVTTGRYRSGKDDLKKECTECKEMFYYNKYKPKLTCSRSCADTLSSKTKSRKKISGELR